jgi:hypothetical protein
MDASATRGRKTTLEATAYHEAGHAVVSFGVGRGVRRVTIIPDGDSLGHITNHGLPAFHPDYKTDGATRRRVEQCVMISLAGAIAEARFKGHRRRLGDGADLAQVFDLASYMVGETEELNAYVRWLWLRTRNLLEVHWPVVEHFAAELLARRHLTGREARAVWLAGLLEPAEPSGEKPAKVKGRKRKGQE